MGKTQPSDWLCECGKRPFDDRIDAWRWDGENWQHYHGYPIGHIMTAYKPEEGDKMSKLKEEELLERLERIVRPAMDHLKYWETKDEQAYQQIKEMIQKPEIKKDWLPTAENINALPEPVRDYIADMQTNADPPSMVADNIIMKDTIKTLEKMLEEKPEPLDLEQKARELFSWSADPRTIKECEDFIREIVK